MMIKPLSLSVKQQNKNENTDLQSSECITVFRDKNILHSMDHIQFISIRPILIIDIGLFIIELE